METRKELKTRAKQTVRSHYLLLLAVCLIAAFLGTEFTGSLSAIRQYSQEAAEPGEEGLSTGATMGAHQMNAINNIAEALSGDVEGGLEDSREQTDEAVASTQDGTRNPMLGRSRGVLAELINSIDSGALLINLIAAVRSIGVSKNVVLALFILIALLLSTFVWFFLTNMYKAVSRRIFLESRTYERVTIQRFLVFLRVKKWTKVSCTMAMLYVFQMLWNLTVVGGIIKHYSYYLTPYIVAENPDLGWKETIALSRRMMYGHKWECFVLEWSFFLWNILGALTMGISDLAFANAYKVATYSEYYTQLRRLAKERRMEGSGGLNDTYLFEKAPEETLQGAYADLLEASRQTGEVFRPTGFRAVIARVFGVSLFRESEQKRYEAEQARQTVREAAEHILAGRSYPGRLSVIPEKQKKESVEQLRYLRCYSVPSLILMYFSFALVGWLWEVSLHLISDGEFVNRGVLHGPWLPIYGTGALLVLVLLNLFRKKPALEFILTVLVCGCVEYFTAYYLELTHGGQKWWDYSGYFLNLHGRICAEGLLVFGIGGVAVVYVIAPLLDNYIRKIKMTLLVPVCAVLLIAFSADQAYSKKHPNEGKGITSVSIAAEMCGLQDVWPQQRGENQ